MAASASTATSFRVDLGPTLSSATPSTSAKQLYAFRYSQKPQSLSTSLPGLISPDVNPGTIYASFGSTGENGAKESHTFTGTEVAGDGAVETGKEKEREVECVLVWDETKQCYVLDLLTSTLRISHDRVARPQPVLPIVRPPSTSPNLNATSLSRSSSHSRLLPPTNSLASPSKHRRTASNPSPDRDVRGRSSLPLPHPLKSSTRSAAEEEVEDFGQISLTPKLGGTSPPPTGGATEVQLPMEEDFGPTPKSGRDDDGSRSRSRSRVPSPVLQDNEDEEMEMEEIVPAPPPPAPTSAPAPTSKSPPKSRAKSPPKPRAVAASKRPPPLAAASKRPPARAAASKRPPSAAAASKRPPVARKAPAPTSTEPNHAQQRPRRRSSIVAPPNHPSTAAATQAARPAVALKSLPAHMRQKMAEDSESESGSEESSGSEDSSEEESGPEGYLAVPGSVLGRSGTGVAGVGTSADSEEEEEDDDEEEEMDWLAESIEIGIQGSSNGAVGSGGKGRGGR